MRFVWLWLMLGTACGGGAPPQDVPPATLQKSLPPPDSETRIPVPAPSGSLALAPLGDGERLSGDKDGLRRIGAHRELPEPLPGVWLPSQDGARVWRLELQSPDAVALRLHFTEFHVAEGSVTVVEADEKHRPDAERRYDGDGPGGDGEFWSDLLEGDAVIIEYRPGDGEAPVAPPFRVREISHMWQSPLDLF